ncbi:MAG: mercury resistance system transport protein MerF [Nitrospiraceae bacterium]
MIQVKRLVEIFVAGCPVYDETRICPFTSIFIVTVGGMGLGTVTGYLDTVFFPGLAVLLSLMLYRLSR